MEDHSKMEPDEKALKNDRLSEKSVKVKPLGNGKPG